MDDRTALKNYTGTLVKTYGPNYWEHWTEDDKETFNILSSRANNAMRARQRAINPDTQIRRTILGVKRDPEYANEQQKIKMWNALKERAGSGIVGTLSPETGLYTGAQPKRRKIKGGKPSTPAAPAAPKFNPDDVDSKSIFAYLMNSN